MRFLKQSTSVDVPIGPFLDSADGNTIEGSLTITQPDIRLKKNGGNWAQKNAAQTLSHEENGNYEVTLDATDTDTLGLLRLHVHESGALPVWEDFMVMPANVWDSLFGADKLQVDAVELGSATQSLADLKDFADDGYDPSTNKVQGVVLTDTVTTYTGNTPQTGDAFARLGAPAGASVSADILVIDNLVDDLESRLGTPSNLGSGATVAANLVDIEGQTDDIGVAGAGLTAITSKTDNLPALPANEATLTTIAGYIDTEVAAIKAKTDTLPATPANEATLTTIASYIDTEVSAIKAKTDTLPATPANEATLTTIAGYIDTEVAAIKAKTDLLPATPAGTGDAMTLTAGERNSVADALLARTLGTEAVSADGAVPTVQQAIFEILSQLGEFSISGTTITYKKRDGTTTLFTATIDSATTPTSKTRAT